MQSAGTRDLRAIVLPLAAVSIVIVCLCISAQSAEPSFGGFFEITASSTQSDSLIVDEISFNVSFVIGDYSAQVDATLTETTLDSLRISVSGSIGEIAVNSTAAFNPSTLEFLSWQTGTAFTLLDVDVSHLLYVTSPQTGSYSQFTISGNAGPIALQASAKLGICPLVFWGASLCADWPWERCATALGACIQMTDAAGVQAVDFTMSDYLLFENLLGVRWNLDVSLSFTPEEKRLTPTLKLQPDWFICPEIQLVGEISTGPGPSTTNVALIYGIKGECAVGRNTTIRFAESLDAGKNGAVTGRTEYFELIGISGALPSCCDSLGSFDVAAFFDGASGSLFDLGLITGAFAVQFTPNFAFSFEAEIPANGSGWQLFWTLQAIW